MCVPFRPTGVFLITMVTFCAVNSIRGQHEQNECGKRQLTIGNRIHGGEETKLDLWPWHAAIFVKNEKKFRYTCGGSILSPKAILTAAHCLFPFRNLVSADEISVHVGRENLTGLTTDVQIKNVSEIRVHPEFRLYYFDNDIAILRLTSDIEMTQFVQPICLWDNNENPSAGDNGTVVGFGFNEKNEVSEILQEATLTMVDGLECLELDRHAYGPVLTSKMFCAGGRPGVSACKGDSGGGMFFTKNDTWYISGIVAFIPKRYDATCDSTKFTVFTKVSKYHQWILGAMNTRSNLKDLEPCKENFVASKTVCNAANKFDHSFLLVGHLDGIRRVPTNGGNVVDIINDGWVLTLDHDCSKGRVYWLSDMKNEIWSAKYDGTDKKLFISQLTQSRNLFVIAVDWISRRLYWSDYEKNAIHVASLDNPDLRSILISDLNRPISIAVDPYRGKLYWVERSRTERSWIEIQIVSSNLDGTERQILISGPHFAHSNDIIRVSMTTGELCYIDYLKIDCIDTENKKIQTIGSNLRRPFGLAVTDDSMYWTNGLPPSDKIERIDLHGVHQEPIPIPYSIVYSITAVTSTCPLFSNACSTDNGGCPENTICLLNPRIQSGRNCIKIKK